jgi:hypothetical protein
MWFPLALALSAVGAPNLGAAFARAAVPGLTNAVAGTSGFARVDLNRAKPYGHVSVTVVYGI